MNDFIVITVADAKGSVPRDAGTSMKVWADRQAGTIGGGALEFDATQTARAMLADSVKKRQRVIPLGPNLGQCCGGSVTLDFRLNALTSEQKTTPLWIWGAGHVGRAVAGVIAPFEDRDITLVDTSADRMPQVLPANVMPLVAVDPPRVVSHAPKHADHLIVTYSHSIDLALCDGLLRHGFSSAGLIGSATKWARFRTRLTAMGHTNAQIAGIACPIGDPALGKHPQAIAVGVAAALISSSVCAAKGERAG